MRVILLIVGVLVGFAAGLGTGILTGRSDSASVPSEIHEACTAFMDAFDDAQADADELNAAEDQDLAHPWRVSDVWAAPHLVALDEAVATVRWEEHAEESGDEWWGVRYTLNEAAVVMGSPGEYGAVEQVEALSAAQTACIGR